LHELLPIFTVADVPGCESPRSGRADGIRIAGAEEG
jgi:hypothetical protein